MFELMLLVPVSGTASEERGPGLGPDLEERSSEGR